MAEYIFGRDAKPVGAEFDSLTDAQRNSITACAEFFAACAERIKHLAERAEQLGRSGADTVITLIDVDDPSGHGALLADHLMPNEDWQQYRDQGKTPTMTGLAAKESFPAILDALGYHIAAQELENSTDLRIVVLHAESVQIMDVQFE